MRFCVIIFGVFGQSFLDCVSAVTRSRADCVCFVAAALVSEGMADGKDAYPDVQIVVFRHGGGISDKEGTKIKERLDARDRDEKAILKAAKDLPLTGLSQYIGGQGGKELFIHAQDLGLWKAAIDKLLKSGSLKYYDRFGLDDLGFGFVPIK
jgi:hypothetical protein